MQRVGFKSNLFGHGRSSPRFVSEIIRELFRPFLARSDFTLLNFTHAAPFSGGVWGIKPQVSEEKIVNTVVNIILHSQQIVAHFIFFDHIYV